MADDSFLLVPAFIFLIQKQLRRTLVLFFFIQPTNTQVELLG